MPGWVLALIVAFVLADVIVLAAVLVRKQRAMLDEMRRELARTGESVELGPEPGSYRGAKSVYGKVKGNGVVALTDRRLLIWKLLGKRIEIPREQICGTASERWFLGAARSSHKHVVLQLRDGNQVGLFVNEPTRWTNALGDPAKG